MNNARKSRFMAQHSSAFAFKSFVQSNIEKGCDINNAYIIFLPDDCEQFESWKIFYNNLSGARWIHKNDIKKYSRSYDDYLVRNIIRKDLKRCLNGKRKTLQGGFAVLKLTDLAKQINYALDNNAFLERKLYG